MSPRRNVRGRAGCGAAAAIRRAARGSPPARPSRPRPWPPAPTRERQRCVLFAAQDDPSAGPPQMPRSEAAAPLSPSLPVSSRITDVLMAVVSQAVHGYRDAAALRRGSLATHLVASRALSSILASAGKRSATEVRPTVPRIGGHPADHLGRRKRVPGRRHSRSRRRERTRARLRHSCPSGKRGGFALFGWHQAVPPIGTLISASPGVPRRGGLAQVVRRSELHSSDERLAARGC